MLEEKRTKYNDEPTTTTTTTNYMGCLFLCLHFILWWKYGYNELTNGERIRSDPYSASLCFALKHRARQRRRRTIQISNHEIYTELYVCIYIRHTHFKLAIGWTGICRVLYIAFCVCVCFFFKHIFLNFIFEFLRLVPWPTFVNCIFLLLKFCSFLAIEKLGKVKNVPN